MQGSGAVVINSTKISANVILQEGCYVEGV